MPYTQTSIQEEMSIIDNRPFQHSSKKRHQVKVRIDIIHPSLYLISLIKLAHSSRMGERSFDSFIVIDFPLFRGTQRQFSENICSEDDLRSRIFGTFLVKLLACLPLLGFSNIYKMV